MEFFTCFDSKEYIIFNYRFTLKQNRSTISLMNVYFKIDLYITGDNEYIKRVLDFLNFSKYMVEIS